MIRPGGFSSNASWFTLLLVTLVVSAAPAQAQQMVLDYLYRYDSQPGEPDHIMNAIEVSGDRAIVSTNRGVTLVNLATLPPGGTSAYLDRLTGFNARDLYRGGGGAFYVNRHRNQPAMGAGLVVVRLNGNDLQLIDSIEETGVLYEKMCVSNGHLYVTAHAYGLRVFSIANLYAPVLVGSLAEGFTDAFAVAVSGDTAFVADGAGGLKVVDVGDPSNPSLMSGETLSTAVGTAEDVIWLHNTAYVALGGAGLGIYPGGDPAARTVFPVDGCAESLCRVGDHLAVGTMGGVLIYDLSGQLPERVGRETAARRGSNADLRICSGVSPATGDRLLCSNWDYLDVYQLVEAPSGTQSDITPGVQRIRFAPAGGTQEVSIRNEGTLPLTVSSVVTDPSAFECDYAGGVIGSGEAISCTIAYDGTGTNVGGTTLFYSDDPDESPLPIQVFGRTDYLDPGESAIDFTLPLLTRDPETGDFNEEIFTLSDHLGQVVWFQIFGTW